MVKHLSASLVDVMYIFYEPSVGLHRAMFKDERVAGEAHGLVQWR